MTDTTQLHRGPAPMGTHVRRFVRSAWILLFAQLAAALLALGVTGSAAFYVADLREERDMLRAELARAQAAEVEPAVFVASAPEEAMTMDPIVPEPDPPVGRPAPLTEATRPTPQPDEARSEPRRDPPPQPRTEEPADQAAAQPQPTPRPRTYPGGLPGQTTTQSEPHFIPPRFRDRPQRPLDRRPPIIVPRFPAPHDQGPDQPPNQDGYDGQSGNGQQTDDYPVVE